jgi:hypothetical protein
MLGIAALAFLYGGFQASSRVAVGFAVIFALLAFVLWLAFE